MENCKRILSEDHILLRKIQLDKNSFKKNEHGSRPKYFNNNFNTSILDTHKHTCVCHTLKVNSIHFVDPYDQINTMVNTNNITRPFDAHKESEKLMKKNKYLVVRLRTQFIKNN